jgi:DnaJ like chaperone protein
VKRAFRQLAAAHHPDKVAHLGPGAVDQANRRFREIRDAYEEIRRLRGL